jgi:hypothetical protein
MMRFEPGTSLPPPTSREIRGFEEYNQVNLPQEYVELLQQGNGGVPIDRLFMQGAQERLIERMFCISDGDPNAFPIHGIFFIGVVLAQVGERLSDSPDITGMDVIPIAELFAGDMLCLDYRRRPLQPEVVVWDHESSTVFAPHVEKIADSFAAFLTLVRSAASQEEEERKS